MLLSIGSEVKVLRSHLQIVAEMQVVLEPLNWWTTKWNYIAVPELQVSISSAALHFGVSSILISIFWVAEWLFVCQTSAHSILAYMGTYVHNTGWSSSEKEATLLWIKILDFFVDLFKCAKKNCLKKLYLLG